MRWKTRLPCGTWAFAALCPATAQAEILAMLNYGSKPEQTVRREGIAVIDSDPESTNFGKILKDIPLPSDLAAHPLYYNQDKSKAYVTALGKSVLHVIVGDAGNDKPLKTIAASAPGKAFIRHPHGIALHDGIGRRRAHHVAFSADERYVFVQNSFVNGPEINDGSITVIDLAKNTAVANIDAPTERSFNPNSMVLLPQS